jgi:hypothetical protein
VRLKVLPLLPLVVSPFVASVPAEAIGGAACTISGTISFMPPPAGAAEGQWRIGPGAIGCQGALNGYHFYGQGPFSGAGTYTGLPAGSGSCLHYLGTGTVDYVMRTGAMVHRIRETKRFTLAGAGKFVTPSLRGSLALAPPFEGDCATKPLSQATFVAQAVLPKTAPFFLPVEDVEP